MFASEILFYNLVMIYQGKKGGSGYLSVDSQGRVSVSSAPGYSNFEVLLRKRA
jgi:hypothetical protein